MAPSGNPIVLIIVEDGVVKIAAETPINFLVMRDGHWVVPTVRSMQVLRQFLGPSLVTELIVEESRLEPGGWKWPIPIR